MSQFKWCLVVGLSVIILSACTLQKKRYSRGYYLNFSRNQTVSTPSISKEHKWQSAPKLVKTEDKKNSQDSCIKRQQVAALTIRFQTKANTETEKDKNKITTSTHVNANKTTLKTSKDKPQTQTINKIKQFKKMDASILQMIKEKNERKARTQKRIWAIITGISLLLMALVAAFSALTIADMFVLGDTALTALNVTGAFGKYTSAVIGWIVIAILDVLVSIGVYKYHRDENKRKAGLTSILRILYTLVLGGAIAQLLSVTRATPATGIYNALNTFNTMWGWGLIVFGCHLILLGILFKNEGGKKWVNILIKSFLIIGGIGYMVQYIGILLVANPVAFAAMVEPIFLAFTILCEILFAIWMLAKGGKTSAK